MSHIALCCLVKLYGALVCPTPHWHIARILHPSAYYLNFPSAPRIAQNPPRSTSLEFERCRKKPKMTLICQDIRKIFPWSVDHRCFGRSTRHPMVGRPQTLWSVDQATFEWNGPKTESSVNDFLHKRAKMCNSDFLDCKLKSQKFNYHFDSISWQYMTLWYQK